MPSRPNTESKLISALINASDVKAAQQFGNQDQGRGAGLDDGGQQARNGCLAGARWPQHKDVVIARCSYFKAAFDLKLALDVGKI